MSAKEMLNDLLVDVFNHILSIEEEELKKNGVVLSMKEVHALEAIERTDDKTMSNVAKKLRITVGSLTTCIDRLVSKGYVSRRNDDYDRRKVLIEPTRKGDAVLEIHKKFHDTMLENALSDMDIENDDSLLKSLENIRDYFRNKY